MIDRDSIREFWNSKAIEDPFWYVSSFGAYGTDRNLDEFWASGQQIWKDIKRAVGYVSDSAGCVVEIGCGVGRLTRAIAPEVARVEALDVSDKMLEVARAGNLPNVTFRLATGFTLQPLPSASADLVIAYCVFQHLPAESALRSYVKEMVRVAKPGGLIAFTLTPRDWRYFALPILRLRAYLRERTGTAGPHGVYRKEWIGIRPRAKAVHALCPVSLRCVQLHGDKLLFFGQVAERVAGPEPTVV